MWMLFVIYVGVGRDGVRSKIVSHLTRSPEAGVDTAGGHNGGWPHGPQLRTTNFMTHFMVKT